MDAMTQSKDPESLNHADVRKNKTKTRLEISKTEVLLTILKTIML